MSATIRMNRIYLITIAVLVAVIWFMPKGCGSNSINLDGDEIHTITRAEKKQKKIKYIKVDRPVAVYSEKPVKAIIDSIPYTDSSYCKELAIDHLTTKYYNDTIEDDTCRIHYQAKIHGNTLDSLSFGYQVKVPFVTINQEKYKPRVQVFIAGNVGPSIDMSDKTVTGFMAGPEFIIKDKKNVLYGASVQWNTTGDTYVQAKVGFMVSFKRR